MKVGPECLESMRALCHELRRPLTVLRGAATLIVEEGGRLPEESRERMLWLMEGAAEAMSEQIDDMLTALELDAGSLELKLETVDLPALLHDVVAVVRRREPDGRIEVEADGGLDVEVDRERTAIALRAVVANAVRHSPPGGLVEVVVSGDASSARVEVLDRGPGIPAEHREVAFEKFTRLQQPTGGAGLGLFLARGLARAMGGEVQIGDRSDGGTAVWFTLNRRG